MPQARMNRRARSISPARMSYGGLVDPSTVEGQVDEEADWCGAVAALLHQGLREESGERGPRTALAHLLESVIAPAQFARGRGRVAGEQLDRARCE